MESITAIVKEYKEERGLLVSGWSCVCNVLYSLHILYHYIFSTHPAISPAIGTYDSLWLEWSCLLSKL